MATDEAPQVLAEPVPPGRWLEVLGIFTRLGLTSFGGPVAHLGYFREEFVARRRWFNDNTYVDLVALCQFLPGPASSQVGIAIGLSRAGYLGALAAWLGFTLPSAVALVLFAYGVSALSDVSNVGWIDGLKVAAVAVVAQAVLGMMRTLAPDRERASLAVAAAVIVLAVPSTWGQIGAIAVGAAVGLWLPRAATAGGASAIIAGFALIVTVPEGSARPSVPTDWGFTGAEQAFERNAMSAPRQSVLWQTAEPSSATIEAPWPSASICWPRPTNSKPRGPLSPLETARPLSFLLSFDRTRCRGGGV
jgi:chromate transport protein ChrA